MKEFNAREVEKLLAWTKKIGKETDELLRRTNYKAAKIKTVASDAPKRHREQQIRPPKT